jgi:regulator of protease activity HflC (stomatin/prohibitin superfamily)
MDIELLDSRSMLEKLMNHFGWYKTQMSDVKIDKLEVDYRFIVEVPKELQDAINQEQVTESSKRKYTKRSTGREASKASIAIALNVQRAAQKKDKKK